MSDFAPISSPNTTTAALTQLTEAQLWQKGFELYDQNTDFWQPMEGTGENNIILTTTDLAKGVGQTLNVRVESELTDEPHYEDETFSDDDDFETLKFDEYQLKIDRIRHAVSAYKRTEEKLGIRGELLSKLPQKLGRWMGRRKTEEIDMLLAHMIPSDNIVYANGKTRDTLVKADGLSLNFASTAGLVMSTMGGKHGHVGTINGQPHLGLTLVTSEAAATVLRQDSGYQSMVFQAQQRGKLNPVFRGEVVDLDGITVVKRRIIDGDGQGSIGSPLNPRAKLGVAIAAGTAAFDVKGGGDATSAAITKKLFFKYFSGYNYKFSNLVTVSPASESRYLLIRNPDNAATDPGKFGFYKYTTGNDGNKITITERLGSAASGVRNTTVGNVTWNAGVWSGKHTDVHPIGALVLEANANGEPLGRSFLLGNCAILRGYGMYRGHRTEEYADGGAIKRCYIASDLGQVLRKDRLERVPSAITMVHALHYPELNLPAIA